MSADVQVKTYIDRLKAKSHITLGFLNNQLFNLTVGSSLQYIDTHLRGLPNMQGYEQWNEPFDSGACTITLTWPRFRYKKSKGSAGDLVPATPLKVIKQAHGNADDSTKEVIEWSDMAQGTILRALV